MLRPLLTPAVCLLLFTGTPDATAQPADAAGRAAALMEEGAAELRAGRPEGALRAFEAAAEADPASPEAHFRLAQLLSAPPFSDARRAGRALAQARRLDPTNLHYMVAELVQLQRDSWNFVEEMILLRRRVALAQAILAVDSSNGFAHEEMGTYYVRDYWLYRNAVALPSLQFRLPSRPREDILGEEQPADIEVVLAENSPLSTRYSEGGTGGRGELDATLGAAGAIPSTDRFDLDAAAQQGAVVQDMTHRADAVYDRARYHLRRALDADPRRRGVYDHLFRIHALAGRFDEALPMLAAMAAYFPEDPETWLYLGTAHHRLGQATEADAAFRQALAKLTPAEAAAFEDLTLFLRPDELAAYRADSATVARRFWGSADPRFLTPENERRLEHYARLTYADLMYRSDDLGIPGWATERGKIHVRYGVPQRDVVIVGGFQQVLEAFPEREGAFASPVTAQEANLFEIWDYGDFRFVFEDPNRNGEFRLYSPPADLFANVGVGAVIPVDYEIQARETFRETPERFTFTPPGRPVQLPYRVTTFRGDAGDTDLYVHYGIPIAGTAAPGPDGALPIPIRTGAFLIDATRDVLAERRRTLYGLRADQVETFEGVRMWTDTQPLRASPGRYTVSLEFEALGGGASATQRREVDAPDYHTGRLALSDVMLAYMVEETEAAEIPGLVVRDGLAIRPAPWGVFEADRPIYLYFEVYALALRDGQSDYEVEARLAPRDEGGGLAGVVRRAIGGRRRGVGTEAEARGSSADDAQYVILDATGQAPGVYTLTLRVRDRVSGQSAERETEVMLE